MSRINSEPPDHERRPDRMEESEYRFHRQKAEPADRHGRPSDSAHDAEVAHKRNLKVFVGFAAFMAIFFFLAIFLAIKSWQIKNLRVTKDIPVFTDAPPEFRGLAASEIALPGSGMPNADAIHKAELIAGRADMQVAESNYTGAVETYLEALRVWPNLVRVHTDLGRLYLDRGDYQKAAFALEKAAQNNPGSPGTLNDLGVAYFGQQRFDRARAQFDAALAIQADYAPSLLNLVLCRRMTRDLGGAREALSRYLRLLPDDPRGLKEKAFFEATDGQYGAALETLDRAIFLAPDWAPLYFDAAATAALMHKPTDAINYLRKAEARTSPFAVYLAYQQPAFQEVRSTDAGKGFQGDLARRARSAPAAGGREIARPTGPEPIVSYRTE